ncbi:MAG: Gx transporter family protein [Candidatus Glassbacteria bacterium]|nr:Gx transporter family protein [Candidatus Glassbacteria bacterium]
MQSPAERAARNLRDAEEVRRRIERLSLIAAATVFEIILFTLDSAIPKPIPWIKIGLANIVTLALLVGAGWRVTAAVHFLRIMIGAVFRGGLFTPFFLLSFGGGAVSFIVMALAVRWAMPVMGFAGVSFLGALAHNTVQLLLVAAAMADNSVLVLLWPAVLLFSLLYGGFTGWCSFHFCRRIPQLTDGRLAEARTG